MHCVLAIGGLDPGGGAGILADARAIERAGAFPCAVATVLTVQSTRGLERVVPVDARTWMEQARVVLRDQRVRAIKTGALGSAANVRAVAKLAKKIPLIVDPVMLPTKGRAKLLDDDALATMRRELLPRAALVTANVAEAEALTGVNVDSIFDACLAGKALVNAGAHAALVKGGHIEGPRAVDVLVTRKSTFTFSSKRIRTKKKLHGAGCTLASLIAGRIACGDDVFAAVRFAKRVHHAAIKRAAVHISGDVGGPMLVLDV